MEKWEEKCRNFIEVGDCLDAENRDCGQLNQ